MELVTYTNRMAFQKDVVVDEDDVNCGGCSLYEVVRDDHVVKQLPIRVMPGKVPIAV